MAATRSGASAPRAGGVFDALEAGGLRADFVAAGRFAAAFFAAFFGFFAAFAVFFAAVMIRV